MDTILDRWGPAFIALWAVGFFLMLVLAIAIRRSKGGLFTPQPAGAVFWEPRASGRSLRNAITMIGGARNCLQVAVTGDRLLTRIMFPFNIAMMFDWFCLENDIPLRNIRFIERKTTLFGRHRVRVEFHRSGSGEEAFEFELRNPDAFSKALGRSYR